MREDNNIRTLASEIMLREDNKQKGAGYRLGLQTAALKAMLITSIASSAAIMIYHILVSSLFLSIVPHMVVIILYITLMLLLRKGTSVKYIALISIIFYAFILTPLVWYQLEMLHPMIIMLICYISIMTILLFDGKMQIRVLIAMLVMLTGMFTFDTVSAFGISTDSGNAYIGQGIGMIILLSVLTYCVLTFKIRYSKLNSEFYRCSMIDPLTGAFNSRKMNELVEEFTQLHIKERFNFSLAIIDMDNFKVVNDTYGHSVGDMLLKKSVEIMEDNLRDGDVLARNGGDEFVVLLPGCKASDAKVVIERLLKNINDIKVADTSGVISFSAGIADIFEIDEIDKGIYSLADRRLYDAKDKGKNMVSIGASA